MTKNALLVLFLVVALAAGVGSSGYAAQDNPATPPGSAEIGAGSSDSPFPGQVN